MTETKTTDKIALNERDRIRRASRARHRRLVAGATPRWASTTALMPWLREGVSRSTWYARRNLDGNVPTADVGENHDQGLDAAAPVRAVLDDCVPSPMSSTATEFGATLARLRAAAPAALAEFSALDQDFRDADDEGLDPIDPLARIFH